jgi:excisionase family DNA binding protein
MTEKLLTAKEAAQYCRVSVKTIYDWKYKGVIPYCKLQGKLLFPVESLLTWIESNFQCAVSTHESPSFLADKESPWRSKK